jgi:predicted AlkP superfamily phosphohydrolase/phosphomutase
MSDHGFTTYQQKIHLNRWLAENGYLALSNGNSSGDLSNVNWTQTKAYAVGLNSLYLNIAGREGQGVVGAGEIENLLTEIQQKLMDWKGPDGKSVAHRIRLKHEIYNGSYTRLADLIVGYAPEIPSPSETGLGKSPSINRAQS